MNNVWFSKSMGCMDAKGYLKVTGKIEEMVITDGRRNVYVLLIVDALKEALPYKSNAPNTISYYVILRVKLISGLLTINKY